MTSNRPRGGFTLLEVLIALTIVVILVGVMSSTITIAFREKNAAERAIEAVRDTQAVGDLMVDELGSAAPPTPATDPSVDAGISADTSTLGLGSNGTAGGLGAVNNGQEAVALYGPFLGYAQSISFYTTGPEPKAPLQHDARWVQYLLGTASDGSQALVRTVDTNLMADQATSNPPQEVLVKHVRNVSFQYWDGTQWLSTWDSTQNYDALPYAVKIELTLDPAEPDGPERTIRRVASIACGSPPTTVDANGLSGMSVTPGLGN